MVDRGPKMRGAETRERWAESITARARAYWTPQRRKGLLGGMRLLCPPWEAAPLLRALRLLRGDASMAPDAVRKYMQVSHMAGLLEPALRGLAGRFSPLRVLDAGCGSSYLSLLLGWCARNRWERPVEILGVDRDPVVIRRCRRSASAAGLEDLVRFDVAELGSLDVPEAWARAFGRASGGRPLVHVLVALHACDTASDDALALGVSWGAELIAAAPCCQAELAREWGALSDAGARGPFAPVWRSGHLRREAGATMTDALRTLLLRGCGYDVTAMEFVASGHTPKNTLLRAIRVGVPDPEAFGEYVALRDALGGADIRLAGLLAGPASESTSDGWTKPR
ncbi:MAG: SAM-dependent methyltransferase [Deltaproteobacteria bacterium]|nr:SAM-dependent methyltransferase [Deltaproteobacteria bacterium]